MKRISVQLTAFILLCVAAAWSQEPLPSQTPPTDDSIKVSTEEIQLNVLAQSSSSGNFVPTLKADDLLVVEEGVPQEITKLERVPANVLLLIDTGRDANFVKNLQATQLIAEIFVQSLPPNNSLSVVQYYSKIETLTGWSNDYDEALRALKNKMFTGNHSRLTEALQAVLMSFKSRPLQNRHLVLITDGVDTVTGDESRQKALRDLRAANITVHVISYTQLEERKAQKATDLIRIGDGKTKPRIDPWIYDEILRGIPMGSSGQEAQMLRARLKQMNESQALLIVNIDREAKKRVRAKRVLWKEAESTLRTLADETGGIFQAPEELSTMFLLAGEIARAVNSQYILTYTPKKPFANPAGGETRKVQVSTHCQGVKIRSRRAIFFNP